MTEDIPLEITSSDMANLPIFIAVLIVAVSVNTRSNTDANMYKALVLGERNATSLCRAQPRMS